MPLFLSPKNRLVLALLCAVWLGFNGLTARYANAQQTVSSADQLLMITSEHCPWCEAFEEEVGSGYHRTAEAQHLPLYRLDIDPDLPESLDIKSPASFTPTFIIIKNKREIARIEGYPGSELFWWRLSEFIPE